MKLFGRTFPPRFAIRDAVLRLCVLAHDLVLSRTVWISAALIIGYWLIVPHIPTVPQNDAIRVGRTSVALAVSIGFGLSLISILRTPWPGLTGTIALGIFLSWFGTAMSSVWVLIWSLANRPQWMLDSNLNGFLIYINMIGGFLHLIAYNAIDGRIPRKSWIKIGVAVGLVFFFSAWLALTNPDARAVADWLKPIFADFPDRPD